MFPQLVGVLAQLGCSPGVVVEVRTRVSGQASVDDSASDGSAN